MAFEREMAKLTLAAVTEAAGGSESYGSVMKRAELSPAVTAESEGQRELFRKDSSAAARFSLKKLLGEILVQQGRSWNVESEMEGASILEAAGPIGTSAFQLITSQLVFSKVMDAYEAPGLIWRDLVQVVPTNRVGGEKVPGISGIAPDDLSYLAEGQTYAPIGMSDIFIDVPPTKKIGAIIPLTRELVMADQTGEVLRRASAGGDALAKQTEKSVLDVVTGIVNTYKFNGSTGNTYLSSGAYVNTKTSNALADFTSVNAALQLLTHMTDPVTGEPILSNARQILVPEALRMTAMRIINATNIRAGSGSAFTADPTDNVEFQTDSANPLGAGWSALSNPFVKARTSSDSTWFIGEFKKAFAVFENWPMTVTPAPSNSEAEFNADIVAQFKLSHRYTPAVLEPRYVVKCTA